MSNFFTVFSPVQRKEGAGGIPDGCTLLGSIVMKKDFTVRSAAC